MERFHFLIIRNKNKGEQSISMLTHVCTFLHACEFRYYIDSGICVYLMCNNNDVRCLLITYAYFLL